MDQASQSDGKREVLTRRGRVVVRMMDTGVASLMARRPWETWRWDGQILVMMSKHVARFSGCWLAAVGLSQHRWHSSWGGYVGLEGCSKKKFPALEAVMLILGVV